MIEFTFESLTFRLNREHSRNLIEFEDQFYNQPTKANLHIAKAELFRVPMIGKIHFEIQHMH